MKAKHIRWVIYAVAALILLIMILPTPDTSSTTPANRPGTEQVSTDEQERTPAFPRYSQHPSLRTGLDPVPAAEQPITTGTATTASGSSSFFEVVYAFFGVIMLIGILWWMMGCPRPGGSQQE